MRAASTSATGPGSLPSVADSSWVMGFRTALACAATITCTRAAGGGLPQRSRGRTGHWNGERSVAWPSATSALLPDPVCMALLGRHPGAHHGPGRRQGVVQEAPDAPTATQVRTCSNSALWAGQGLGMWAVPLGSARPGVLSHHSSARLLSWPSAPAAWLAAGCAGACCTPTGRQDPAESEALGRHVMLLLPPLPPLLSGCEVPAAGWRAGTPGQGPGRAHLHRPDQGWRQILVDEDGRKGHGTPRGPGPARGREAQQLAGLHQLLLLRGRRLQPRLPDLHANRPACVPMNMHTVRAWPRLSLLPEAPLPCHR